MRFQWQCGSGKVILLVSAYFTLVLSLVLRRNGIWLPPMDGFRGYLHTVLPGVGLYAAGVVVGAVLLWPYVGKIFFLPLILLAGVLLTATFGLDIALDSHGLEGLLAAMRRPGESLGIMGAALVVASGILPAMVLFLTHIEYRPLLGELALRSVLVASGCAVLFLLGMLYQQAVPSRPRRGIRRNRHRYAAVAKPSSPGRKSHAQRTSGAGSIGEKVAATGFVNQE